MQERSQKSGASTTGAGKLPQVGDTITLSLGSSRFGSTTVVTDVILKDSIYYLGYLLNGSPYIAPLIPEITQGEANRLATTAGGFTVSMGDSHWPAINFSKTGIKNFNTCTFRQRVKYIHGEIGKSMKKHYER